MPFAEMVALAESITDKPSLFKRKVSWQSNGPKGHLHEDCRCLDYPRTGKVFTRMLSVHEAAGFKVCPRCAPKVLSSLSKVPDYRSFQFLLSTAISISEQQKLVSHPDTDLDTVYQAVYYAQCDIEDLGRMRDSGEMDKFTKSIDRMLQEARQVEADASRRVDMLKPQIVRAASASLVKGRDHRRSKLFATAEEDRIAGDDYHGPYAIMDIYNAWVRVVTPEKTNTAAVKALARGLHGLNLYSLEQLRGVEVVPVIGEDMLETSMRCWNLEKNRLIQGMLDRWSDAFAHNLTDTKTRIVGILHADSIFCDDSDILGPIVHAYRVRENKSTDTVFLRVPAVLSKWLVEMGQDTVWETGVPTIQVYPGDLGSELLETVSALWDPSDHSGSSYTSLKVCVKAAKAL